MAWFRAALLASASLAALSLPGIDAARADNSDVVHTSYDGNTNDLLTAGLGKTGLESPMRAGWSC